MTATPFPSLCRTPRPALRAQSLEGGAATGPPWSLGEVTPSRGQPHRVSQSPLRPGRSELLWGKRLSAWSQQSEPRPRTSVWVGGSVPGGLLSAGCPRGRGHQATCHVIGNALGKPPQRARRGLPGGPTREAVGSDTKTIAGTCTACLPCAGCCAKCSRCLSHLFSQTQRVHGEITPPSLKVRKPCG